MDYDKLIAITTLIGSLLSFGGLYIGALLQVGWLMYGSFCLFAVLFTICIFFPYDKMNKKFVPAEEEIETKESQNWS